MPAERRESSGSWSTGGWQVEDQQTTNGLSQTSRKMHPLGYFGCPAEESTSRTDHRNTLAGLGRESTVEGVCLPSQGTSEAKGGGNLPSVAGTLSRATPVGTPATRAMKLPSC